MPELETLSKELDKMDAQIISICSDTADARGKVDEELLELAQQITQKTGVTFPTPIPDKALHDGLLKGAMGYPTTFFMDSQGNMVGEPVPGQPPGRKAQRSASGAAGTTVSEIQLRPPDGLPWAQPVGQRCDHAESGWENLGALCGQHRLQGTAGVSG